MCMWGNDTIKPPLDRQGNQGQKCIHERGDHTQALEQGRALIVKTSDGEQYTVLHPEFLLVGRYNLVIEDERGGIDVIDPLHVVAIRRGPSAKTKNSK